MPLPFLFYVLFVVVQQSCQMPMKKKMKKNIIFIPTQSRKTKNSNELKISQDRYGNQKLRARRDPKAIHEHKSPAVCNAKPVFEVQSSWAKDLAQGKYEEKKKKRMKRKRGKRSLYSFWKGSPRPTHRLTAPAHQIFREDGLEFLRNGSRGSKPFSKNISKPRTRNDHHVSELPKGHKAIVCRLVLKVKHIADVEWIIEYTSDCSWL